MITKKKKKQNKKEEEEGLIELLSGPRITLLP
jgi:hypothetical protein